MANNRGKKNGNSGGHEKSGTLIAIGGHENKEGHRPILQELASRVGSGRLVVATLGSEIPEELWEEYSRVFGELGVKDIKWLHSGEREMLIENPPLELLDGATAIFFTGGDQMKITSRFGGTQLCERMRELYQRGATIAGTSSGASVMSEVMIAGGKGDESLQSRDSRRLAPGLGLITGVIIDQHFAERGRIGRLLGAVAQNPRLLGIGIDEDTSLVFESVDEATVLGSGGVYILDGREMTYTNAGEDSPGVVLSSFGIKIHVLNNGDRFDLLTRQPQPGPKEVAHRS